LAFLIRQRANPYLLVVFCELNDHYLDILSHPITIQVVSNVQTIHKPREWQIKVKKDTPSVHSKNRATYSLAQMDPEGQFRPLIEAHGSSPYHFLGN
jgi:hypothetical protein